MCSFEASAVPILVYLCIVLMVHKYRQSAKESCSLKRNTLPEVFPLTARITGSGKTKPFEKRHAGCEEREKINRRRIYDTLRINFFEATKQTACIFSKGGEAGVIAVTSAKDKFPSECVWIEYEAVR